MAFLNNNKLIHQLASHQTEISVSLWLDGSTREYVMDINLSEQKNAPLSDDELLRTLTELENYYQCLITPPIVAAAQKEYTYLEPKLQIKRSVPGLGKLTGRTRLKVQAHGAAGLLGQLFRLLHPQETHGTLCFSKEEELGKSVQKIFMCES